MIPIAVCAAFGTSFSYASASAELEQLRLSLILRIPPSLSFLLLFLLPLHEISDRKTKYLGHIHRHPNCREFSIIFHSSEEGPRERIGLNWPLQKQLIKSKPIETLLLRQDTWVIHTLPVSQSLNSNTSPPQGWKTWCNATTQLHLIIPVAEGKEL